MITKKTRDMIVARLEAHSEGDKKVAEMYDKHGDMGQVNAMHYESRADGFRSAAKVVKEWPSVMDNDTSEEELNLLVNKIMCAFSIDQTHFHTLKNLLEDS